MDYSKRGINKKKKQIRSSAPKAEKKLRFTAFRAVIICILLIAVGGVSAVVGGIKGVVDSSPEIDPEDIAPDAFKSYIYDQNGNELLELSDYDANRIEVDITAMSKDLQNAFIALEDSRFWTHDGIDPQGIVRAFVVGIKNFNFSEGASTITQQVIKNSIFSGGNESNMLLKFKRKFQEQFLALQLEKEVSKEKILQTYMNTINLGEGCYGVEAAAQMYFGKSASEVTASEAAVLASIAQSPTEFNPYRNPEKNAERRKVCLGDMLEQGYIDQATYDAALSEDIYTRIAENTQTYKAVNNRATTYYEDAVIDALIDELIELNGYEDDPATPDVNEAIVQGKRKLYSGGYSVYLAQDEDMQRIVDSYYADNSNFTTTEYLLQWVMTTFDENNNPTNYSTEYFEQVMKNYYGGNYNLLYSSEEAARSDIALFKELEGIEDNEKNQERFSLVPQVQSSFVLIDQRTGYVKALVGGRGEKTESRTFNRATQALRQPGSSFKIVSTYAPAMDTYDETLSSTNLDSPYTVTQGDGTSHTFNNVDYSYTYSQMTYKQAIMLSKNTVATRVMDEVVTPSYAYDFLQERFHFTTLVDSDKVTAMALGGLTNGVTNYEMTAAFAAIANNGVYTKPVLYTHVLDHDGNVIIDHRVAETSVALKPSTASMLTEAMEAVMTSGTGTHAALYNMASAGKTGTSENRRDYWFMGYTPYYTAGIWFGYDDNTSIYSRNTYLYAQQVLWHNIMTDIHEGLENKEFELPDSVEKVYVCTITGKRASSTCPGEYRVFDMGQAPNEWCSGHYYSNTSNDNNTASGTTPGTDTTGGNTSTGGTTGGGDAGTSGGDAGTGGDTSGGGDAGISPEG